MKEGTIEFITTAGAPAAIGPYSVGIKIDTVQAPYLIFTSGQLPIDPETKKIVEGGIGEQTERVILNLKAILEAAGSSLDKVVKTVVYLTKKEDFPAMNEVYKKHFGHDCPVRSTVVVELVVPGALVEIEAIAVAEE